jgi:PilZ domain-containing protein
MSTSTDQFAAMNAPIERRFYPRVTPSAPIYVAFGSNNLGTLLNVSENGFSVGTPEPLDLNSVYRVYLSLDGASSAITVSVRTVWTSHAQNSSGIQLLDLSEQDREQIRNWVALQTSRNESLDGWFSPQKVEPSTTSAQPAATPIPSTREDESAHEDAELPPPETPKPQAKPEFPPMPLPIHGEFTYEPPPSQKTQILPVRRHSAPRPKSPKSRSRSSMAGLLLWTAAMAAICLGAGWSFRHQLADKLHRSAALFAKESTPSASQDSSAVVPDQPGAVAPFTEDSSTGAPSNPAASAGADDNAAAAPTSSPISASAPTAAPTADAPAVATSKHREPNLPASRLDMDAPRKRFAEPVALEPPRSYVANSPAAEAPAAPALIAKNETISAPATVSQPAPAPVVTAQNPPVAPAAANTAPAPARNQPSANASAADHSIATNPSVNTPPRKSAIAGSIYESDGSSRAGTSSNSFVARGSNVTNSSATQPNSSTIQMDATAAPVVEVTPPKSLAASFVDLPGERVLRSGSMTMHIQRSVRIPRERIPGERFIWRGHMKVTVGELTSRVDPQVSQLPFPYGSIAVQATIDKGGYVTNLQPLYGSYTLLPNVARAIREWRYEPTYVDNKPAETQAKIEIDIRPPSARTSKP